ncbi:hypothetical protein Fmac_011111 [Flemingia macrophylla]|uniref:Uncharacterized protein n=1 Tax=Flemingia macrophylla TaxID=520843 RepID=A0ABD1MNM7_9FABA
MAKMVVRIYCKKTIVNKNISVKYTQKNVSWSKTDFVSFPSTVVSNFQCSV